MKEGFWSSKDDVDLPDPKPRDKPWKGRRDFLSALDEVEQEARLVVYKGISVCRLCSEPNGNAEFHFGGWQWPAGFRHYIQKHNVKPTNAFREFVTGKRVD